MNNEQARNLLLTQLRRQMNGAVSEAMARHGIIYRLNYGVSLPTIKEIALRHAPNHTLARELYQSDVRELRIAGLYIADPEQVTVEEVEFWQSGADNKELKDLVNFILLRKVSH